MSNLSSTILALLRNPETPDYALRDVVLEENGHVASVYVVFGRCGTHSDERTWHVAAYLDREHADARVAALTDWAKRNALHADETEFNGYQDGSRGGRAGYPLVRSNYDTRTARADALNMDDHDYLVMIWETGPDPVGWEETKAEYWNPPTDVHYGVFEVPLRAEG